MKDDPFPLLLDIFFLSQDNYFNINLILGLLFVAFLVFLSALVSGSEVSFFSLNSNDLQSLSIIDKNKEKKIRTLLKEPNKLLATILIANNFINVGIIVISYYLTSKIFLFESSEILQFLIQVVSITFVLVLLGEITPKVYAKQNAVAFSTRMIPLINFFTIIFTPLSSILLITTSFIDNKLNQRNSSVSMQEISKAIDLASHGDKYDDENRILKSIVEFGNIDVKEIMKPRTDVVAIERKASYSEVIDLIQSSSYSRIPVYESTFDNVKGVLHIKDLIPYLAEKEFDWFKLCQSPLFVPETKKINDLLKEFQDKKIHLAIVVDEYGGTSGIVTLEDVLEEIVGEINDEFDDEGHKYSRLDDNTFVFEAKTSLNDFLKIVDGKTDYFDSIKGDTDTIAGIILEKNGVIPKVAQKIDFPPYLFIIESVDDRRIKRVKVCIDR